MRTRDLDFVLLSLTRDGRLADPASLEALRARLPDATDCFVFCHGWLYDREEARQGAARFFSLLDGALLPVGEHVKPIRVAIHWPSKPFGADGATPGAGGATAGSDGARPRADSEPRGVAPDREEPELLDGLERLRRAEPGRARQLALALAEAEVPRGPEEELELDGLIRGLRTPDTRASMLSPLHALSFWTMKRRAGEVGERLGREHLGPLLVGLGDQAPRLHLIGHSFGGKLVASAVLGGLRPRSLTLLLAAFSAFAFAPEVPDMDAPGHYHPLLAERTVTGTIAVLHSDHDRALGSLYPAVTGAGQLDRGRGARKSREVVARSALGAVGARGVGAPEVDLLDAPRTGLPRQAVVNVNGSRVVRASEWLIGAHRDIHHAEIATLIALAAGLVPRGHRGVPRPGSTHSHTGGDR